MYGAIPRKQEKFKYLLFIVVYIIVALHIQIFIIGSKVNPTFNTNLGMACEMACHKVLLYMANDFL